MPPTHNLAPAYGGMTYPVATTQIGDKYLTWFAWVLWGYAIGSRGFAYVGIPPLFIGEITLAFGLLALCFSRSLPRVLLLTPSRLLLLVMAWGGIRTLPYISQYGIDALRDAVTYGYGLFAFITAALLIDKPERLRVFLLRYRKFAVVFLCIMWALFLAKRMGYVRFPHVMGSHVEIIEMLGGPILVHVAGAAAFILVGMARSNPILLALVGVNFLVIGLIKRSGMLAFIVAMFVLLIFKHAQIRISQLILWTGVLLLLIGIATPFSGFVTKSRTISVEQLWINIVTIVSTEEIEGTNADETKEWRLAWWRTILDYTFGGEYFWTGKGFGINLAEDDGFIKMKTVKQGAPVRSPHNSHLTMLARTGVPGFLLWLLLQLSWALAISAACLRSRRVGDHAWSGIFLFLLVYWTGFMVEASFNVAFEGPYQGIWFWAIFGLGLASLHIYRYHPEIARP